VSRIKVGNISEKAFRNLEVSFPSFRWSNFALNNVILMLTFRRFVFILSFELFCEKNGQLIIK